MELDLSGGDSMTAPGAGGLLNGGARKDPGSGGVHISGEIVASGGSIMKGGNGNGADGGRIDMELTPTDGAVTIDQSGKITVEGGNAGGARNRRWRRPRLVLHQGRRRDHRRDHQRARRQRARSRAASAAAAE